MNYRTALQIYVRDNSYFKNYNLVYYSVYKPFRTREDIKTILEKVKKKEELSEEEKVKLVKVFRKGSLNYRNADFIDLYIAIYQKENFPIKRENIELSKYIEKKNSVYKEELSK